MKDALGHGSNTRGAFMERQAKRYTEAQDRIDRANAMGDEMKAAKKAAKKSGASIFPGWDSGAEEFVRRAIGTAGLAHNSLKNGAAYLHEEKMAEADNAIHLARGRLDAFKMRHGV